MPAPDRFSRSFALIVVLVVLAAACITTIDDRGSTETGGGRTAVRVVAVIDGDTIRVDLAGEETPVRLIGIDTPEKDGPYTDLECYGEESSRYTAESLDGRGVELEFDVERTDRFDRTLAYVWVDGTLFNERILREGYAVLATFPPNVRYVERFTAAQQRARGARAGLWASCGVG